MEELQDLLTELTAGDQARKDAYLVDIEQAKKELEFHHDKIKYLEALVEQREQFVEQITTKLNKVDKFGGKIKDLLA